jgi:tRNA threonylcarbamoyladenosine biosynthesis protein TsaB
MRTLVIDTATKACSVALYESDVAIASHHEVIGRGHAERLLPFIAALPERGRSNQIVVNVGPGSFTGIRVGVAAARALGLAWDVPVSGYGCLTLVAAMALEQQNPPVNVDVVMAGGHGEYFFQSFDSAGSALSNAVSLSPPMVAERSRADIIAGDAAADLSAIFGNRDIVELLPEAAFWHLLADVTPLPASPIYGRAPDAKLPQGKAA